MALEREIFGFDHAELGARVVEGWSLPDADLLSLAAWAHLGFDDDTVARVLEISADRIDAARAFAG